MPGGLPPAGEPNAVNTAPCQMTQPGQPDEVVVVRLRPMEHHPKPVSGCSTSQ